MTTTTSPTSRISMQSLNIDFLHALLAEMKRAGLRPASGDESGEWWTSLDGTKHWVTAL